MDKCISGIIKIESIDISCSFIVENFEVTLIPNQDKNSKRKLREWADKVYEQEEFEWLAGTTSENKPIHIARRSRCGYKLSSGRNIGTVNFFAPIIIENIDSLLGDCHGFYGVEFIGGDINLVYPPDKAIDYSSDSYAIQYRDASTYTDIYNIELDKESFRLIKTIDARYVMTYGKVVDLPRNIQSKLRIEFDTEKPFKEVFKYYGYIINLVTFLTRISKNECSVRLLTKYSSGENRYYKDFATVSFYKDVSSEKVDILTIRDVLKLDDIGDAIVPLFKLLNNTEKAPSLLFLSDTVKSRSSIKYTQIIDICSAIEIEYKYGEQRQIDDKLKTESINLAKQINDFIDSVETEDILKNKAQSIISTFVKNYKPSLKEQIKWLYQLYRKELDSVIENHFWIPKLSDEEFYKFVNQFTKMRHSTAHQKMDWNGGERIYIYLMLLIYFSIFNRAGVSIEVAKKSITNGFFNIF